LFPWAKNFTLIA